MKSRRGSAGRRHSGATLEGIIKRHPDGFGFFIPNDPTHPDVYIPKSEMRGVMSQDRVLIYVTPEPDGRFRGQLEEIKQRFTQRVMGQLHRVRGLSLIRDEALVWGEDLLVKVPPHLDVREGDWVSAQIESYPDEPEGFRGAVVSKVGDPSDPLYDNIRMLHIHNIPMEFSKRTLRECQEFSDEIDPLNYPRRRDIRSLPLVTIDGRTAKDFDDAIFVEKTAQGFRAVVAIADVSHYVKMGTALDEDAYIRGTSTYFPNFVAPMLPEKLSNELCSLKPHVPRLCFVADMQVDFQGQLLDTEFYEAIMVSRARVTYGEAQELLEQVEGQSQFEAQVENSIRLASDLAKILMAKRFREGAIDLELPETQIDVNEAGLVVDIMHAERLFSHRLIEELMLLANIAVARFFVEHQIPALFRVHDPPAADALETFQSFLKTCGYQKSIRGGNLQIKISRALQELKGHPKERILHMLALRSMSQAKYAHKNVGHFGLGFADYTHFTSPIRRYPDLIVHRLLKGHLMPEEYSHSYTPSDLESAGVMLSACEQRSVKAERQIHAIKKARFISQFIGQEFDGQISSVAKFGLFVHLRVYDVDGLIRIESLEQGDLQYDEENLRLVSRRSKFAYNIGDPLRIKVIATHIDMGQIDFAVAERDFSGQRKVPDYGDKTPRPKGAKLGRQAWSNRKAKRSFAKRRTT